MFSVFAALMAQLRNIVSDRRDLVLENAALRHELAIYQRKAHRPHLISADRRFWVWLSRAWPGWRTALVIVQPETVIKWHRDAWKRYWTWKSRRHSRGRPRIAPEVRDLIIRMARENPLWGAQRSAARCSALATMSAAKRYDGTCTRLGAGHRPRPGALS